VGIALVAALAYWVLRGIEPEALLQQLRQASPAGLALAAVLNLGHNVFRAWRWRVLLAPVRPAVPYRSLLRALILGYAATWALPGRVGELVRPALLASRERLPLGPCLGSVVADRLLDGACVLGLLGVGLTLNALPGPAPGVQAAALWLLLIVGLPAAGLFVALLARRRFLRWAAAHSGFLGWLARAAVSLGQGLEALRRPELLLQIGVSTLLAWGTIALATWVGVRACGIAIGLGSVLMLLPLLVLGIALPTPGGAGGYHAAMKFGLVRLCFVAEAAAVGAGILMHAAIVLPVMAAAALLLLFERGGLEELRDAVRQFRGLGARA
jgi:glycosyltransferase 2 family protein